MQIGQSVNYYADANADARDASVAEIVGLGPSLAKKLDLTYRVDGKDRTAEDVPHEADADGDGHFWLLKGERRSRREESEEDDEEPPALAVPDGVPELPSVRKAASKQKK